MAKPTWLITSIVLVVSGLGPQLAETEALLPDLRGLRSGGGCVPG